MTLQLEGDLDILKLYLYTENKVAGLRHSKLLMLDEICFAITSKMKKNTKITPGQRSNDTNFPTLLAFTVAHIPTKLHRFRIYSFGDFVHTDTQTDIRRPNNTCLQHSWRAGNTEASAADTMSLSTNVFCFQI